MSRRSSPPLFVHLHHLNCVLLDPGSGCASPLSINSVAFGVVTWSTSRISTVQVGQTVLDHYTGSRCASPHSIDGVAFCVDTWSTSRTSTVQVGRMVLDHYISVLIVQFIYCCVVLEDQVKLYEGRCESTEENCTCTRCYCTGESKRDHIVLR